MKSFIIIFSCLASTLSAQLTHPPNPSVDVLHYRFYLTFADSTDAISGKAFITASFKASISEFEIDLVKKNSNGKGMTVLNVGPEEIVKSFEHTDTDVIKITLKSNAPVGKSLTFEIAYQGIPEDGLIISSNKYGERVFFGDNWPNRGRYWLPTVDHPSDKATVEYLITAPEKYQVVATGVQMEESNLRGKMKLTHWKETTPVPTKVMTVGMARFATQLIKIVNGIPISTWVYPQDRTNGFSDFAVAPEVLEFFDRFIGPYPYDKLAHVQSKTRWGGLENASNIFYFENVVNGKNEREGLIAHETAHQWFGNSVTEKDWHHVWLSEGFATYLTHTYFEHKYGETRRQKEMKNDRNEIMKSKITRSSPIIDTTIMSLGDLLNINTYQKAGWVLHMLRKKVGDEPFWKGVKNYFMKYQNENALTSDFQKEIEATSGMDLSNFFASWIYKAGHPVIAGSWDYDKKNKEVILNIKQTQKEIYDASLEIIFELEQGHKPVKVIVDLNKYTQKISVKSPKKPINVVLDPNANLLFEGKIED